jgi:hypothetical protein
MSIVKKTHQNVDWGCGILRGLTNRLLEAGENPELCRNGDDAKSV